MVGLVIGKGGDMIKKIQADTGAKVQFINLNEDTPDDRRCLITGNPDQVAEAKQRIEALVDSALVSYTSYFDFLIFFLLNYNKYLNVIRIEVATGKVVVILTEIKVGVIVVKRNH